MMNLRASAKPFAIRGVLAKKIARTQNVQIPYTCMKKFELRFVIWLGSHGGNRPAQDFANTWAPGLNLTSPDSWYAPLLQALSASHAVLLQDYGCVAWTSESDRVPAPLTVSIALPFVQPSVGSRNSPPRYLL